MVRATAGLLAAFAAAPSEGLPAPSVALTWQAPMTCPDRGGVLQRLHALAPTRPVARPGLRAEGLVSPLPDGIFRLQLTLRGPGLADQRAIEATDCTTLADVTALLIAIAIAPKSVADRLGPVSPGPPHRDAFVSSPVPIVPTAPASDEPAIPSTSIARLGLDDASLEPPRPAPPPRSALRGALRIAGGGEIGGIPGWSPTAGLAAAVLGPQWRVELAGTYSARVVAYDEAPQIRGRLSLLAGALRGCGVPRWRRLEFPICGGVELGLLGAVGRGVEAPRPARELWIAAQLAPGVAWVPSPYVAVSLGLDVLIALRRPGFHVDSLRELARSEPVGLRPMVGLEARFP